MRGAIRLAWVHLAAAVCMSPFATGCIPAAALGPNPIRVATDTLVLTASPSAVYVTVSLVLRNYTSRPLYIEDCGAIAERNMGKTWEVVWSPACLGGVPPGIVLPGDSVAFGLLLAAYKTNGAEPRFDPRMTPGSYRLVLPIGHSTSPFSITDPLPLKKRTSPVFVLIAPKPT
jgi:hypothetical protein